MFHHIIGGGTMFKIFTFRQLAIMSAFISFILLFSAFLNTISPVINTNTDAGAKVTIIMYHHICDKKSLWGDYVISTNDLEEDFIYLRNNGITPISFAQLKSYTLEGTALPPKCVILTFDDGQKSFLTKVVPLLQKYNFPANVNIVGSLVELYTENGDNNDCYAYLNQEDLRTLKNNPLVEIGCHSYNLHSLNKRRGASRLHGETDSQYRNLIINDTKAFTDTYFSAVNDKTDIYAYPYGIRNNFLQNTLREQGFSITLTCRESVNIIKKGDSLYELGRFNRAYGINRDYFFKKCFD
jgi:peptidoglycan/xylan/chitin deacetylase (PgdA/CDA1 family)